MSQEKDVKTKEIEKVYDSQLPKVQNIEEVSVDQMFNEDWSTLKSIEVTAEYFSPTELKLAEGEELKAIYFGASKMRDMNDPEKLRDSVKFYAKIEKDQKPKLFVSSSTILVGTLREFTAGQKMLITYLGQVKSKVGKYDNFKISIVG